MTEFGLPPDVLAQLQSVATDVPAGTAERMGFPLGRDAAVCACGQSSLYHLARAFTPPQAVTAPLTAEQVAFYASEEWAAHGAKWTAEALCQSSD